MRVTMSILSVDGCRKAVVTSCDNGAVVDYYRSVQYGGPGCERTWRFVYQVLMPVPYHVALDQAHSRIHAEG